LSNKRIGGRKRESVIESRLTRSVAILKVLMIMANRLKISEPMIMLVHTVKDLTNKEREA